MLNNVVHYFLCEITAKDENECFSLLFALQNAQVNKVCWKKRWGFLFSEEPPEPFIERLICVLLESQITLTDGIFETGVSNTLCSNPSFRDSTKYQVFIPASDFLFFAKIRLEITNIWCGVSGNLSKYEWWCQNS